MCRFGVEVSHTYIYIYTKFFSDITMIILIKTFYTYKNYNIILINGLWPKAQQNLTVANNGLNETIKVLLYLNV